MQADEPLPDSLDEPEPSPERVHFAVVDEVTGDIAWGGHCPPADLKNQRAPDGYVVREINTQILNPDLVRWEKGEIVVYAPPPPTIEQLRAARWEAAKAMRDQRINGGCATTFGRADSDETSRNYMLGARELARDAISAGSTQPVGWKMADDSIVPLTPDQLIQMTREVGLFVAACQANAQAIGIAITAAADEAALAVIKITAGYPLA